VDGRGFGGFSDGLSTVKRLLYCNKRLFFIDDKGL